MNQPSFIWYDEGLVLYYRDETFVFAYSKGKMDGFWIFNYLLTPEEVKKVMEPNHTFGPWGTQEAMENYLKYKIDLKKKKTIQQEEREILTKNIIEKWRHRMKEEAMLYGPGHPNYNAYMDQLMQRSAMVDMMAEELVNILDEFLKDKN